MNMFSSVSKLTSCVHPTFGGRVGLTQIAILRTAHTELSLVGLGWA